MEPIGGYFSLELPFCEEYHKDAIRLNTGRNCLEYILRVRQYSKVFIPYYTCDTVLEPFHKLGISYEFYHINNHLELPHEIEVNVGEALLYTNYYGLKQRYTEALARQYGGRLIVDNTQAFYAKPIEGIDTFYTCRKFFGVPDGAYLYTDKTLDEVFVRDLSFERMSSLIKRIDISPEAGFLDFRNTRRALIGQPIKQMSKLTQRMMMGIDYKAIARKRRLNFEILHQALGSKNKVRLPLEEDAVPMVYPFGGHVQGMRETLIENKVYVAQYWPNVMEWTNPGTIEHQLASQMQPLPIDQRYGEDEMRAIISIINNV